MFQRATIVCSGLLSLAVFAGCDRAEMERARTENDALNARLAKLEQQLKQAQEERKNELEKLAAEFKKAQAEREMDVRLPAVVPAPLATKAEIIVGLHWDGHYTVRGKRLSVEELEELLGETARAHDALSVVIRADERVELQYVARVMGICEREGIFHSVAVEQSRTDDVDLTTEEADASEEAATPAAQSNETP